MSEATKPISHAANRLSGPSMILRFGSIPDDAPTPLSAQDESPIGLCTLAPPPALSSSAGFSQSSRQPPNLSFSHFSTKQKDKDKDKDKDKGKQKDKDKEEHPLHPDVIDTKQTRIKKEDFVSLSSASASDSDHNDNDNDNEEEAEDDDAFTSDDERNNPEKTRTLHPTRQMQEMTIHQYTHHAIRPRNRGDNKAAGTELSGSESMIIQSHGSHKKKRIRSSPWTKEEDERLAAIVRGSTQRNWKQISRVLGMKRSADQCCQRWHRVLSPDLNREEWTPQEDQLLVDLMSSHGLGGWPEILARFPQRSELQCRFRWSTLKRRQKLIFHLETPQTTPQTTPQSTPQSTPVLATNPFNLNEAIAASADQPLKHQNQPGSTTADLTITQSGKGCAAAPTNMSTSAYMQNRMAQSSPLSIQMPPPSLQLSNAQVPSPLLPQMMSPLPAPRMTQSSPLSMQMPPPPFFSAQATSPSTNSQMPPPQMANSPLSSQWPSPFANAQLPSPLTAAKNNASSYANNSPLSAQWPSPLLSKLPLLNPQISSPLASQWPSPLAAQLPSPLPSPLSQQLHGPQLLFPASNAVPQFPHPHGSTPNALQYLNSLSIHQAAQQILQQQQQMQQQQQQQQQQQIQQMQMQLQMQMQTKTKTQQSDNSLGSVAQSDAAPASVSSDPIRNRSASDSANTQDIRMKINSLLN